MKKINQDISYYEIKSNINTVLLIIYVGYLNDFSHGKSKKKRELHKF